MNARLWRGFGLGDALVCGSGAFAGACGSDPSVARIREVTA
jgi:hypothetical protein